MVERLSKINEQLDKEFDRHASVESRLNQEKIDLEKVVIKNHEDRDQLIAGHKSVLTKLDQKVEFLNAEIESMSKEDISQKLRIKVRVRRSNFRHNRFLDAGRRSKYGGATTQ